MMDDDQPPYSRDEFISELTSYYEFLVKMYLPASAIKYPPEGGWPDITPSYLAFKTETVNDLIRHMPFIRQDRPPAWPYQIYDKTSAVDYNGPEVKASLSLNPNNPESVDPLREEITTLPPHVMTFARTSGGRDGFYFFFDTERGTATMADFQYGPTHTELSLVSHDSYGFSSFRRAFWRTITFATDARPRSLLMRTPLRRLGVSTQRTASANSSSC